MSLAPRLALRSFMLVTQGHELDRKWRVPQASRLSQEDLAKLEMQGRAAMATAAKTGLMVIVGLLVTPSFTLAQDHPRTDSPNVGRARCGYKIICVPSMLRTLELPPECRADSTSTENLSPQELKRQELLCRVSPDLLKGKYGARTVNGVGQEASAEGDDWTPIVSGGSEEVVGEVPLSRTEPETFSTRHVRF